MKGSNDAPTEFNAKVNVPPNRAGIQRRQGSVEENRFNNDYYNNGTGKYTKEFNSSSSSTRENMEKNKYETRGGGIENHGSQMSMKRNESDFQIQKSLPQKKSGKYNSLDRGALYDENEVSPMLMKKKANVHLQPMSHKKISLIPTGEGMRGADTMIHSESNPLLAQQLAINDRVKLEKLTHIPSVKSNLLASDSMSAGFNEVPSTNPGINYEAMPIGKKSVLAPINISNTQISLDQGHPVLSKIDNSNSMLNRKNNRTLKPL